MVQREAYTDAHVALVDGSPVPVDQDGRFAAMVVGFPLQSLHRDARSLLRERRLAEIDF